MTKRFCTECGKQFFSENRVCPYCNTKNRPLPGEIPVEDRTYERTNTRNHPITQKEYEDFNTAVIIGAAAGRLINDTHSHFVEERRHNEVLAAIREAGSRK